MSRLGWFRSGQKIDWPRVLLVSLGVVIAISLIVGAAISLAVFNPYNPTWEGTSEFRSSMDAHPQQELRIVQSTSAYETLDATNTTVFIIAPEETYSAEASASIQSFIEAGGRVVVLDNFGPYANELMASVGGSATFDGQLVRDEREHFRGPTMPIASGVEAHRLTNGVSQLTLNYATAIEPHDATVLVRSSEYAYLGAEDDDIGDDDELAAHPVVTVESIGAGELVAVGDPSITINEMLDQPDNRIFIETLTADMDTVVIDVSHSSQIPPLRSLVLWLRSNTIAQIGVGLTAVLAIVVLSGWLAGHLGRRFTDDDSTDIPRPSSEARDIDAARVAHLSRHHPEWDVSRLQRIVAGINPGWDEPEVDNDE